MSEKISASADGKRNAFTFHCEITQNMQQYAVCLSKAEKLKQGTLNVKMHSQCAGAIEYNSCPAAAMRRQELEAGHAIHFRERTGGPIPSSGSVGTGLRSIQTVAEVHQSPVTEAPKDRPAVVDYAAVINQRIKELKK